VITATGGLNIAAVAGTPFTATVATFTDSNAAATPTSFTATINWGDTTTSAGTITANGQLFSVTGTHTYAIAGSFTVTVKISDVAPGTGTATVTDTATVASPITASPVNFHAVAGSPFTGTVATFTDINAAATPASFTATINWGDATPVSAGTITVNGQVFSVTGSHTYATFGSFQATVTISDVPPGTGTATATDTATVAALNSPTLTKAFGADQINPGETVPVTFTLHNPNPNSLTGVAFTDTLPIGLVAQSLTATVCGGVLTAAGSTISLTGATLSANATCQFSVDVTVQAFAGTLTNPAITITSNEALPGTSAPAEMFVSPLLFLWFFAS